MPMPKKGNNVRIIWFSENNKKNVVNVHVELNLFDFDDFLIYGAQYIIYSQKTVDKVFTTVNFTYNHASVTVYASVLVAGHRLLIFCL